MGPSNQVLDVLEILASKILEAWRFWVLLERCDAKQYPEFGAAPRSSVEVQIPHLCSAHPGKVEHGCLKGKYVTVLLGCLPLELPLRVPRFPGSRCVVLGESMLSSTTLNTPLADLRTELEDCFLFFLNIPFKNLHI